MSLIGTIHMELENLGQDARTQMSSIFTELGHAEQAQQAATLLGAMNVPPSVVAQLRDWMELHPRALLPWWLSVLEAEDYSRLLCEKRRLDAEAFDAEHKERQATARERLGPMRASSNFNDEVTQSRPLRRVADTGPTKKATPEQVLAFIATAGEMELGIVGSEDARFLKVETLVHPFWLRIFFFLDTQKWKVEFEVVKSVAKAPKQGHPAVPQLLHTAWMFYRRLDPDIFDSRLEDLFQELRHAVKDWYKL
jgi:hypothetical protein